jgi:hypothetical protein
MILTFEMVRFIIILTDKGMTDTYKLDIILILKWSENNE